MNYLNIRLTVLRSPEYVGSDPIARATWLSVCGYCADQENGGRIKGCQTWGDRRWAQTCGVYRKEVDAAASLLRWDGEDLIVFGYPADQETVIQAKRAGGSAGGRARAEKLEVFQQDQVQTPACNPAPLALPALDKAPARPAASPASATVSQGGAKRAVKVASYGDIMNPANDVVDLCSAVTGDSSDRGRGFWRKVQSAIGPEHIRSQLCTLWGELQSNERPNNPAAILTGRLKQLMDRRVG
jgi:hypothetical protein